MSARLRLNPFTAPTEGIVRSLEASVEKGEGGMLLFRFVLDADLDRVRVPPRKPPAQTRELWKHTCFEAFLAPEAGSGYFELNFSPSTEWAAYSFSDYRKDMTPVGVVPPPDIRVEATPARLQLEARVDANALLNAAKRGASTAKFRVALGTVVEDERGTISYWALEHAPHRPDFHHPDGFIVEV